MPITPTTVEAYIEVLTPDRKEAVSKLRQVFLENLPEGFVETINYGMIGYVVPHSLYPEGYHCDPKQPLPFINIASQKGFIAIYHIGLYADDKLLEWFTAEFPKHSNTKLDMGKSCIRFKKPEQIPFELIAQLAKKVTPNNWIETYVRQFRDKKT
jgi:hypothetical protein